MPLKHGMWRTPEFATWMRIRSRCSNPKDTSYERYGARGIRVCDRWQSDFMAFYADMGPRPSADHSIERENNAGNYEPTNCRWATRSEQAHNKRNNVHLTFRGRTLTMTEWAREIGVSHATIHRRLKKGWPPEVALSRPTTPGIKFDPDPDHPEYARILNDLRGMAR